MTRLTGWTLLIFVFVATLLLSGLSSFGIWDPHELEPANRARELVTSGESSHSHPPLPAWVMAQSFSLLGVREWTGRLPIALAGLLALGVAFALAHLFGGRRAALYSIVVTATSPLFLFNSRQMVGHAFGFLAHACIAWGGLVWLTQATQQRGFGLLLLAAGLGLGFFSEGALLGVLPPLLALSVWGTLLVRANEASSSPSGFKRWACVLPIALLTLVCLVFTFVAIQMHQADMNLWIGSTFKGSSNLTFEKTLEQIFHAFAPWSALLPLAFVISADSSANTTLVEPNDRSYVAHGGAFFLLWAGFGYALQSLFTPGYGPATFLPVVALGCLVGVSLDRAQSYNRLPAAVSVVCLLLAGLLVRDYLLFPTSPTSAFAFQPLKMPEVFNPKRSWGAVLGVFAVVSFMALEVPSNALACKPSAPYLWIRDQWRKNLWAKVALSVALAALVSFLAFTIFAHLTRNRYPWTTSTIKWSGRLSLALLVLPVAVAGLQTLFALWSRFPKARFAPLLASGVLVGVYTAHGFTPALSAHLSPRGVYDTYRALAKPAEPLGVYQVGAGAVDYYAIPSVREFRSMAQVTDFLKSPKRVWMAFPNDALGQVDHTFRSITQRHLFVPHTGNDKIFLATNQTLPGRKDENPLSAAVLDAPPKLDVKVNALLQDKLELLGFNLKLPHPGYVAPGESFTVEWVYRVLQPISGSWKIFVHVDGHGQRLNGDHDPLEGRYPLSLWKRDDILVDRQSLDVPSTYPAGQYSLFLGFFSGDTRMQVVRGPQDDTNRIRAGFLRIR